MSIASRGSISLKPSQVPALALTALAELGQLLLGSLSSARAPPLQSSPKTAPQNHPGGKKWLWGMHSMKGSSRRGGRNNQPLKLFPFCISFLPKVPKKSLLALGFKKEYFILRASQSLQDGLRGAEFPAGTKPGSGSTSGTAPVCTKGC